MGGSTPSSALIVSTYNNPQALNKILDAIVSGSTLPCEVVIADDGSISETAELISSHPLGQMCKVQHCWHEDRGFRKAKILNSAIRATTAGYVVFLDGDCVPESNFLRDHLALAENGYFVQGRRAFIAQDSVPSFLNGEESIVGLFLKKKIFGGFKAVRWPIPYIEKNQKVRGLLGCNLAIWRNDLFLVNGFDEEYEGWGGEDSDICIRLYNNHIRRKMVYGRCRVYHLNHNEEDKSLAHERFSRLENTIQLKKSICKKGITHLK